ncbi:MAG: hypothetical protein J6C23_02525 [Clostridia bacterium]|nr:hypothetical protein [Clostridia bacterium]
MKKLLTVFLSCALAIILLTLTACGATATDTTYAGNYEEVDAQTLYVSTRNVKNEINEVPTLESKAGINVNFNFTHKTETSDYTSIDKASVYGKIVFAIEEIDGVEQRKIFANLTYVASNETTIDGEKTNITTTQKLYSDGENFYSHLTQVANGIEKPTKYELKYKISYDTFLEALNEITAEMDDNQTSQVPTAENEFITFVNNLKTNAGYRFAMENGENELKIKVDLADKDKFVEYNEDNGLCEEGFSLSVNKMEMFYVFDKEGNLIATKLANSTKQSSPYGNISISIDMDTRAYTGAVSLPSSFEGFTDVSLFD